MPGAGGEEPPQRQDRTVNPETVHTEGQDAQGRGFGLGDPTCLRPELGELHEQKDGADV